MEISTHAPREGSDYAGPAMAAPPSISTHAPREGSDISASRAMMSGVRFQPTLPARGATLSSRSCGRPWRFQPTLPARGATRGELILLHDGKKDFNPRSPRGERR